MSDQEKVERLIEQIIARASTGELEAQAHGLDLSQVDVHGRTPLMVAAAEGFHAAAEILVQKGASVHSVGSGNITALHEAAANGRVAVANYLLSIGAKVDAETIDGVTPLMCAAAWGNIEVARLLLRRGADFNRADCSGSTAADIAREKGEDGTADMINAYARARDNG
jgi:uncharacterized protein